MEAKDATLRTCFQGNIYTKYYLSQMHMLAVKNRTHHVTENMLMISISTSTIDSLLRIYVGFSLNKVFLDAI